MSLFDSLNSQPQQPMNPMQRLQALKQNPSSVLQQAGFNVPQGCCFSLSVRAVDATPDAETVAINVQNSNLVINRIA